ERKDGIACAKGARIDSAHGVALATEACRLNHHEACVAVVKRFMDPANPQHREYMELGCKQKIDDACDKLGRLEIAAHTTSNSGCEQGERNACIQVGRNAVSSTPAVVPAGNAATAVPQADH